MQKKNKKNAKIVDRFLRKYFTNQNYSNLIPAMKYGTLFGGSSVSREQCTMDNTATNRGRYISGIELSTSDGTNLRSGRATLLRQKYS